MKIIYDSALRDMLLNEEQKVIDNVLPSLAVYQALLIIKGIADTKELERKKELERIERDGGASKLRQSMIIVKEEPVIEKKMTAHELKKHQSLIAQ